MWAGSLLVFVALIAGGTAVAVGTYSWRERSEPGAASFTLLMVGVAVWSLPYAVAPVTFDPVLREAMEIPLEVGKAVVAPAWLFFALGYTGRGGYVTPKVVAASYLLPVATLVLVATTGSHDLLWTNYRIAGTFGAATVLYDPGPWHYVHAAYGWMAIGAGVVLLLETVVSYGELYRDQGGALLVGTVVSFAAHVKAVFLLPPAPALDPTPLAPDVDPGADGGQLLDLIDSRGFRTYEVTISDVRDHHERIVGHTVTLTDVTEREGRRQRLEVLNRVLRHNLRNGMTVVVGRAEMLAERLDGEEHGWAEAVVRGVVGSRRSAGRPATWRTSSPTGVPNAGRRTSSPCFGRLPTPPVRTPKSP